MRRLIIELKTTDGSFRTFPFNILKFRKQEEYKGKKRPVIELEGIKHGYVIRTFNTPEQRDLIFSKIAESERLLINCEELFGDACAPEDINKLCNRYGTFYVRRALVLINASPQTELVKVYPTLIEGLLPAELDWFAMDAARTLPYPRDIREHGISPFTFYRKILCGY